LKKFPNLESSIKNIKFIVDSTYFETQFEQFVTAYEKKKAPQLHPFSPEFRKRKKKQKSNLQTSLIWN